MKAMHWLAEVATHPTVLLAPAVIISTSTAAAAAPLTQWQDTQQIRHTTGLDSG
jgi:hypothetical protein